MRLVVELAGNYYSNGDVVDAPAGMRVDVLQNVKIRNTSVNLRRASSPVGGFSFEVTDRTQEITRQLKGNNTYFLATEVTLYYSLEDDASFADYNSFQMTITGVSHNALVYNFTASDRTYLLTRSLDVPSTVLATGVAESGVTRIELDDISGFPDSGLVRIGGDEFVSYTGKAGNEIIGVVRARLGGTPGSFDEGESVVFVYRAEGHPVDIVENLIIKGGGYLVGLGLDHNYLDAEYFRDVKNLIPDWTMRLYIYDVDDLSKFLEEQVLQAINARFIVTNENRIGLVRLGIDRLVPDGTIVEKDISKYQQTTLNFSDIVNRIKIEFDYDDGAGTFRSIYEARDDASIASFGEAKEITYSFRGLRSNLDGLERAKEIVDHYFQRFANVSPRIKINVNLNKAANIEVGKSLNVVSNFIPSSRGILGINENLELLKRSFDMVKGEFSLELSYPNYSALSPSFIAPSTTVESINDDGTITFGTTENFAVGYTLRIGKVRGDARWGTGQWGRFVWGGGDGRTAVWGRGKWGEFKWGTATFDYLFGQYEIEVITSGNRVVLVGEVDKIAVGDVVAFDLFDFVTAEQKDCAFIEEGYSINA